MPVLPKPQLEKLKPCYHGGPNYAELKKLGISLMRLWIFRLAQPVSGTGGT
ncbi:L-threonine 3-O-phosphate decarboxylase [Dehalococcoides mccartyi]|uniref:L-threonine 3-O-phosphate decarboxylase n=1 Tax=Dehalococcoides mccartyi TaxID=61435 RepID=A0A328EQ02_9CHLR|nr:L-threonine 3-O-phosphate decarboxylase [Dehalococcoides mccartyi]